jgi:hypothetical protein
MGLASELSKLFPGRQRLGINPRMMPRPLPVLLTLVPGAAEFQPFIRMSIPLKTARNHFKVMAGIVASTRKQVEGRFAVNRLG